MRIVIDARMYGPKRWTGIGRYLQQLLAQLEQLDDDNKYIVLLGRENFDEYRPTAPNFKKLLAPYAPYSFGEQIGLAALLYRLRPDLVHFPTFNAPILYLGRHVTTIHDLTLVYYRTTRYTGLKRLFQGYKQLPFRLTLWMMAKTSAHLFTPTEFVKSQLVARYHLPASKVTATLLSFDPTPPPPEPLDRFGIKPGYLLYYGNTYPYKNVDRLVDAFAQLLPHHPNEQLVIGGRDDYFRQLLRQRVAGLGVGDRIVFAPSPTDGEIVSLNRNAKLFINPSLSEGFGLQGLEAMIEGTPVLAANASCLPEIYGDAAAYFDPSSTDDLARMLGELLDHPAELERLSRAGLEHIKGFSWERVAEATLAIYQSTGTKKEPR